MTSSWPAVSFQINSIFVSHNGEHISNDDEVRDARPDPADCEIGGDGGAHIRDPLCALN